MRTGLAPSATAASAYSRRRSAATIRQESCRVLLGRKGGLKGGRARADKLTKEQRSESARKAALARWKKAKAD